MDGSSDPHPGVRGLYNGLNILDRTKFVAQDDVRRESTQSMFHP